MDFTWSWFSNFFSRAQNERFFRFVKYKNNKDTFYPFYLFSRSVILWENLAGAFRDTPCRKKLLLDHDFLLFLRLLVNQKKILTNIETVQLPRAPTRAGQAAVRPTRAAQAACLLSARCGRRALAPGDPPPFFGNPLCYTSTCRTMRSKTFWSRNSFLYF